MGSGEAMKGSLVRKLVRWGTLCEDSTYLKRKMLNNRKKIPFSQSGN
jgi:hypothetical protein